MPRPKDVPVWCYDPADPNDIVRPPTLYLRRGWTDTEGEETSLEPSLENLNYLFNRVTSAVSYNSKLDLYNWIDGDIDGFGQTHPGVLAYDPVRKWWVTIDRITRLVYISCDGLSWAQAGAPPIPVTFPASNIAASPDGKLVYIATNGSSLVSVNGGVSWTGYAGIGAVSNPVWCIYDQIGERWLAGHGPSVWISDDGITWASAPGGAGPLGASDVVLSAAVATSGDQEGRVVIVGKDPVGGTPALIAWTDDITDDPVTWTLGSSEDETADIRSVWFDAGDELFMAAAKNRIIASIDGDEWTTVHTPTQIGPAPASGFICITSDGNGTWYAAEGTSPSQVALWCTEDRGVTWRRVKLFMWLQHSVDVSRGLAYGGGQFVTTFAYKFGDAKYRSYATLRGDVDAVAQPAAFLPAGATSEGGYVEIQYNGAALNREAVLDIRGPALVASEGVGKTVLDLDALGNIPPPAFMQTAAVDTLLDGATANDETELMRIPILLEGQSSGFVEAVGYVSAYVVGTDTVDPADLDVVHIATYRVKVSAIWNGTSGSQRIAVATEISGGGVNPAPGDISVSAYTGDISDDPEVIISVNGIDQDLGGDAALRWVAYFHGIRGAGPLITISDGA